MRDRIVVKTSDVPELNRQKWRGFAVRSEESAIFSGVLINAHGDMQSSLNIFNRAAYVHVQTIARGTNDSKAVRFGEMNDGVIIFRGRTKPLGEFLHGEELAIREARRIVEFLQ